MKKETLVSVLFYIAALYESVLGIAFLFGASSVFEWYGVTPPNHIGYVQFPAAILITFGLLYLAVARNQVANRNLIPYGMLLKVSYCGVVFYYWMTSELPSMWKPYAIFDLIFLLLFMWAYLSIRPENRVAV